MHTKVTPTKDKYLPTIGLEVHIELRTNTKMFCDSLNKPTDAHPNIHICPICMGHPGTLPTINKKAIECVFMVGKALRGNISDYSLFDRKNYFYPDIPKGYQISQYERPLVMGGVLRQVHIRRIHLEEDTARLIHDEEMGGSSLVDFNRAGIPLMELVTEPDITSGEEARKFAEELQLILRYLGVSDADMEHGQMRVEANISLGNFMENNIFGTKVEVKNLNSFRSVERAINFEILRQGDLLRRGESIVQETRGRDEDKQITFPQREKEEAHDYRYLPEPDLPPIVFFSNPDEISLPELPDERRDYLAREFGIKPEQIEILVVKKYLGDFLKKVSDVLEKDSLELAVNYLTSDLAGLVKRGGGISEEVKISPTNFAELIRLIKKERISSRVAKDVLSIMFNENKDPREIVKNLEVEQQNDEEITKKFVKLILEENPLVVEDFKKGKANAIQFLVGETMKKSKGKLNPEMLKKCLQDELS